MNEQERYRAYLSALKSSFFKLCRLRFLNPDGSTAFALDNNPRNRRSRAFVQEGDISVNLQNGQRRQASVLLSNLDDAYEYGINHVWFGQQIALDEGMILPDGSEFYLPQGVFYVENPAETLQPGHKFAEYSLVDKWANRLTGEMKGRGLLSYKRVRRNYDAIIRDFAALPREKTEKIRVGVVGEIYVKFSPLGNNNLEEFLLSEGAEVVVPGLLDFCLYCVYNQLNDHKLYGLMSAAKTFVLRMVYNMLVKKQRDVIDAVNAEGTFRPGGYFPHTVELVRGYISHGVKMGEGWLLTAEMLELIEQGAGNIVCTQPFGCLPNHIVGKGMMRVIKERNPQSNIVAVDYDPGATKINQENRIKLMLANAASIAEQAGAGKTVPMPQHENEYDSANTPVHNPFLNPTPTSSSRN